MRKRWVIGGLCLAVLLGVGYTGYWFWLAQTFQQNLALWVDQQRAMGYRLAYAADGPHGFPLAVAIGLDDVVIESPPGQAPWRLITASKLLSLSPWAPLSLRISDGGERVPCNVRWTADGRDYDIVVDGIDTTLHLSTQGDLPAIRIAGDSVDVREDGKTIAGVTQASGSVDFLPAMSHTESSVEFRLAARGIDFQASRAVDTRTEQTHDWLLAGQVKGPVPLGPLPTALATWSNDGGRIELTEFNADWEAATELSGDGTVALDERLQPVGSFSAVVRGYNEAVDAAVARGFMTPAQGAAAKFWLNARAEKDDRGLKVKLPLTIQDGFLSMGPLKLARLPIMAWQ
ncbi:MAG TPA: DUF2125 domain-containing protein [Candidatus Angelobacter sp.]|nr:DUF2125 domain-containing protein [Candidatus Angelobacter sp.]